MELLNQRVSFQSLPSESFRWILWTLYHEDCEAGCGLFSREQWVIWDEVHTAVGLDSVQCSCVLVNSAWGQTPPLFTFLPHPSMSWHTPCTACRERSAPDGSCAWTRRETGSVTL